jgi:hypothetical protein
MAPRAGLPQVSSTNGLGRQTCLQSNFDPQRFSHVLANLFLPAVTLSSTPKGALTVAGRDVVPDASVWPRPPAETRPMSVQGGTL